LAERITCDLCVIGAGLGGLTAVAEARALGASVVLVERGKMGGDYLNTGAVPSAALATAAAHAAAVRNAAVFGVMAEEPRINTRKVHDFVEQVISGLAPRDAVSRVESLGAQVIKAEGKFQDARTLVAGDAEIRARRFIIATGARTVVPPLQGLEGVPFFTSETIFDNTRKLSHLVIVGGDTTALELGQSFHRLGAQVTVIEPKTALADADPELSTIVLGQLREEGVDIRERTQVVSIQPRSQGIGVVVRNGETEQTLDVSHIMVAHDRVPNLDALELDRAGIKRDPADRNRLALSKGLRTSNRRVYAIGGAASWPRFGHLGVWQAGIVVRNAILGLPIEADPRAVPAIVSTDPELAEIGLSEADGRERLGDRFTVLRAGFTENDRARAGRVTHGVAKLVVGKDGTILGAGIVGNRAGELIALFSYAIAHKMPAATLASFVAPHPSLATIAQQLGREYSRTVGVSPLKQRLAALVRLLP
jgi:pyruvate/2-oxoglutarate dehydrogenase complex dihydrolipoamide dehydrogenase (E3) component